MARAGLLRFVACGESREHVMNRPFADRADAGHVLARSLAKYAHAPDVIVLGLPRGGVPVAREVSRALGAPLDVFLVRKLGAPGQEELAMGAIAAGDVVVMNDEVVRALKVSPESVEAEVESERRELARREQIYRGGRAPIDVMGKTVILIDDGLATGSTMRAAVAALRKRGPARIVVAVPVGAASTCDELASIADECVCAVAPEHFRAVGLWYDDFAQTSDDEVCEILAGTGGDPAPARTSQPADPESAHEEGTPEPEAMKNAEHPDVSVRDVEIASGDRTVRGTLRIPEGASAVVVFAHGSGSGRFSPRNQYVARVLEDAGLATLLVDLLEEDEANNRARVFDIPLLASRLTSCARWLAGQPATARLRLGYFGASTGAAAALQAAADQDLTVHAIVSRGGRPDLARDVLPRVTVPTLLIIGGDDEIVLELNREAFELLECRRQLDVVPGASHLFAEPGALEEVARLAKEWFLQNLT
jgi:putative phosphoribosyl transferase